MVETRDILVGELRRMSNDLHSEVEDAKTLALTAQGEAKSKLGWFHGIGIMTVMITIVAMIFASITSRERDIVASLMKIEKSQTELLYRLNQVDQQISNHTSRGNGNGRGTGKGNRLGVCP